MQPELTPLIFGRYVGEGRVFSKTTGMHEQALALSGKLGDLLGEKESLLAVFMGRIGAGSNASARSTRRPLDDLLVSGRP